MGWAGKIERQRAYATRERITLTLPFNGFRRASFWEGCEQSLPYFAVMRPLCLFIAVL